MMNEQQEEEPKEPREQIAPWYPDYFVVRATGDWMVSRETARAIERALDRWPRPRWFRLVDVTGATVRFRLADVKYLKQSTAEQRALWRRFKKERKAEGPDEVSDWDVDF